MAEMIKPNIGQSGLSAKEKQANGCSTKGHAGKGGHRTNKAHSSQTIALCNGDVCSVNWKPIRRTA